MMSIFFVNCTFYHEKFIFVSLKNKFNRQINRMNRRKSRRHIVDLKSTVNQFNIIKIYTVFTEQHSTNSIQDPIDYKPGNIGTYPGTYNKVQKFHGLKVLKSYGVCSLITVELCWNKYQKIFENNPHIFKCNVTFTKRDLWLSHWKLP